jgi:hypothetical protein
MQIADDDLIDARDPVRDLDEHPADVAGILIYDVEELLIISTACLTSRKTAAQIPAKIKSKIIIDVVFVRLIMIPRHR